MKRSKKRVTISLNKVIIYSLIIIFLIWFFGFSDIIKKNCKQDTNCFNEALAKCKSVKYIHIEDNNIYDYVIEGSKKDSCIVSIKLRRMGIGTPVDLVNKLEGKNMGCNIPKANLNARIDEIKDLLNFCSGNLKEGIYEIIIDRLYGLILKNLGGIITEIDKEIYSINY